MRATYRQPASDGGPPGATPRADNEGHTFRCHHDERWIRRVSWLTTGCYLPVDALSRRLDALSRRPPSGPQTAGRARSPGSRPMVTPCRARVLLPGKQRTGHFGVGPRPTVEKLAE